MKFIVFLAIIAYVFAAVTLDVTDVTRNGKSNNIEWKSVVGKHSKKVAAAVNEVKPLMTEDFKKVWCMEADANCDGAREALFTKNGYSELKEIAAEVNVPLVDLAWFNFYIDTFMFNVEKTDKGFSNIPSANFIFNYKTVGHGATFSPVKMSATLRDIAVVVKVDDFTGVTFSGMVGFVFVMKKGEYTASYNNLAGTPGNSDMTGTKIARLFSTNLRNLVESEATFADAKKALSDTTRNAADVFYTIAGKNKDEGAVIQIKKNAQLPIIRSFTDDAWYLAQDAEVVEEEKYVDDNDSGLLLNVTKSADKIGEKDMNYKSILLRISTWPSRNVSTVAVITAEAKSDSMDVVLNGCHNIYKDFGKNKISHCAEDADTFNLGVTLVSLLIGGSILTLWIRGAQNAKKFQNNYKPIAE